MQLKPSRSINLAARTSKSVVRRKGAGHAIDRFYVWYESNLAAGRMKRGSRLTPECKLVSARSITDGPFAETKEIVGGYWFIVAASLEEAAALAAENPCLAFGLVLEIRPLDREKARASAVTNETPLVWRSR